MKKLAAFAVFLLLPGCLSSNHWVKDGMTFAARDQIMFDCEVKGAQSVPPNVQIGWNGYGYASEDTNASLRQRYVRQCLSQRGLRSMDIPPCPAKLAGMVRRGELQRPKRIRVASNSCSILMPDQTWLIYTPTTIAQAN
ncbi:MAG: hypothetical protein QNJ16_03035 [Rhodobacter sp.]|nr:hypothetical protein [Rhodobacter sp.]